MPPILRDSSPNRRPPRASPTKRGRGDDRSLASGHSRPSSVILPNSDPLTRELSDLSGSYLNGNTAPRTEEHSSSSSGNTYRPWRLAKILSAREPTHPQPHDDGSSSKAFRNSDGIEVVDSSVVPWLRQISISSSASTSSSSYEGEGSPPKNHRVPLVILLMDPSRKLYELMQLWVDVGVDSVRDVLQAVQLNLMDTWKQDYDGIFGVGDNKKLNTLIHVLPLSHYRPHPRQIWVAKPWAMSAKATQALAYNLLPHLQSLGLIEYTNHTLTLTQVAQSRIYVPQGILRHHHACQFLSFCPSFEPVRRQPVRVDVLAVGSEDESSSISNSKATASVTSVALRSNSSFVPDPNSLAARDGVEEETIEEERVRRWSSLLCALRCHRRHPPPQERQDRGLWKVWEDNESISVVSESSRVPLLLQSTSGRGSF